MAAWLLRRPGARSRGLASVVDSSFQLVIAGACAVVLLTTVLAGWLLVISRPDVTRYEHGVSALQDSHNAMLDQETGIRAYLATGESQFLEPYRKGLSNVAVADTALFPLTRDQELAPDVFQLFLAQDRWVESWAQPQIQAAAQKAYAPDSLALVRALNRGKVVFDAYRVAEQRLVVAAEGRLNEKRHQQIASLIVAIVLAVLIGLAILGGAIHRRRMLRRDLLAPIDGLLAGLAAVRDGKFDERVVLEGPTELLQIVDGFNTMTQALGDARTEVELRQQHIHEQSTRLRGILRMVREIGGSLNLKYVLKSVIDGVGTVTQAKQVIVWLVDEDDILLLPVRSSDDEGPPVGVEPVELGTGVVGRAAKYGRSTHSTATDGDEAGRLAVPLIIGARVVGVLELVLADHEKLTDDQVEVLETLSVHAAAAIEAARLHQHTSHASEHDPLTRLANRRRLEAELTLECERSLRYGRPVALIMLDLDHFKRVNDTYGHSRGDEILQGVAEIITGTLRSTDTAYRFGGEELVVLARESDSNAAMTLAERIRASIEQSFGGEGEGGITASLGIALVPEHAASPKSLLAAADAALYVSKREGRNRCTLAVAPKAGLVEAPAALIGEIAASLRT
jgi:diguanylate cyclase (GGDEF)-like protein